MKELRECSVWLSFVVRMYLASGELVEKGSRECRELVAIFTRSVTTAKKNMGNL